MDTVTHAVEALVGRALAAPSRAASSMAKYFGAAATGCPMYSIKLQDPYLHGHTHRNLGTQRQQWDSLWRQSGATVTALCNRPPPPSPLCTHATTTGLAHGYGIQPTFSPPKNDATRRQADAKPLSWSAEAMDGTYWEGSATVPKCM
jgi:hypothetical protein